MVGAIGLRLKLTRRSGAVESFENRLTRSAIAGSWGGLCVARSWSLLGG